LNGVTTALAGDVNDFLPLFRDDAEDSYKIGGAVRAASLFTFRAQRSHNDSAGTGAATALEESGILANFCQSCYDFLYEHNEYFPTGLSQELHR
jgi:hypothetical protein